MDELAAKYKKSKLRISWLEELKKNMALSENDVNTSGEREFIKVLMDKVDEYLENAYEICYPDDYERLW